jgi:hypothetical protein
MPSYSFFDGLQWLLEKNRNWIFGRPKNAAARFVLKMLLQEAGVR